MDFETAVMEGIEARRAKDGAQWRLGDLAAAVETKYGESRLQEFAERTGVEYDTLREYRWVAQKYESVERSTLSWMHHRAAAPWPDRSYWITTAETERLSVREMVAARKAELPADDQGELEAPPLPFEDPIEDEPDRIALLAEEDEAEAALHEAAESPDEDVLAADVEQAAKAVRYAVNRFLTTFNRTFDPLQEVVKYVVAKPESLPERDRQAIRGRLDRLKNTISYVEQYI